MERNISTKQLDLKDTLIHYNKPELISKHLPKAKSNFHGLSSLKIAVAKESEYVIPPADKSACTEEILDYIFPPNQWEENGNLWRQTISSDPVTTEGIAKLSERLDEFLKEQKAKEDGIDAIRAKLFGQFFDEIIRIETVICGERGLLLGRVRDDVKYTLAVYRKLFESCMGYALRKSLQATQKKEDETKTLLGLKDNNMFLQHEIADMKTKTATFQIEINLQREAEKKKHEDSLAYLKEINMQLKDKLRALIVKQKRRDASVEHRKST